MTTPFPTEARLVAIVGGSGSGKSWLASELQNRLGREALRISLDDFYLDRSHLPAARRAQLNFDRPSSIDWRLLEAVLQSLARGTQTRMPRYDFQTHARLSGWAVLQPRAIVLVEGLWLLRRPSIRRQFDLKIFLDCPEKLRFDRRMERDCLERGRTPESVEKQFQECVLPMHERFVVPQKRHADLILTPETVNHHVEWLAEQLGLKPRLTCGNIPAPATL